MSSGTAGISVLNLGRIHVESILHSPGCWQASGPHCLLARHVSFLPCGLLTTRHLTSLSKGSERRVRVRQEEREPWCKPQSFCTLVLKVISHHFCHNSLVRSESLGVGHTRGKGLHRAWRPGEEAHWAPSQRLSITRVGWYLPTLRG